MEKADEALAAKGGNKWDEARSLFREACDLESQAAMTLLESSQAEPTRSVLFRSAASLAISGDWPDYAAYLIACGLQGSPPMEIREELCELLSAVQSAFAPSRQNVSADARGGVRSELLVSSILGLTSTVDGVWKTLTQTNLVGSRLTDSLITQILTTTRETLRRVTEDGRLALELFGIGSGRGDRWVSITLPPPVLPDEWLMAAKQLVSEQEEALLAGRSLSGCTEDLANRGVFSVDDVVALHEVGIRAVAALPVRAIGDKQTEHAALILLALASDREAFADDLMGHVLAHCATLLAIAIEIGRRDEALSEDLSQFETDESRPSVD